MGFFSFLFGSQKSKKQHLALQIQNDQAERTYKDLYVGLIGIPAPDVSTREKIKTEVEKAFEDPRSFFDNNNKYTLAIRGLYFPKHLGVTPKFVFIDTMIEEKLMAEVDWKEEESEIRQRIIAVMNAKQLPFLISDEERYDDFDTEATIQMINDDELVPNGYWLQVLDIQSDCYVFTIISAKERKMVAGIFAQL